MNYADDSSPHKQTQYMDYFCWMSSVKPLLNQKPCGRMEMHRIQVAWSKEQSPPSVWFGKLSHPLICIWSNLKSSQPLTKKFQSTPCFTLLKGSIRITFSGGTWHLPTLQKVSIPGLTTMASVCSSWPKTPDPKTQKSSFIKQRSRFIKGY